MMRRKMDPRTARRLAEIERARERQIERDAARRVPARPEARTVEIPAVSMAALVGVA